LQILSLLCSVYEKAPEASKNLALQVTELCSSNIDKRHGQAKETGKSKRKSSTDPSYRPPRAVITTTKDKADLQSAQHQSLRRSGRSYEVNTDVSSQKVQAHAAVEPAAQVALLEAPRPVKTVGTIATPPTEEIPRRAIDSNPPDKADNFALAEMASPKEIVYEAIRSIRMLENYPSDNPRSTYQQMIQHISQSRNTPSADSEVMTDLSTWTQILDALEAQTLRTSTFSMLALLGFYNWFSQKVASCQLTQKSKRGKLLGERGAKIYVLDALVGRVSKTGDEVRDKMMN
jgi:hypothetical protein